MASVPTYVTSSVTSALRNIGVKITANQLLSTDVQQGASTYGVFTSALTQLGYDSLVEKLFASSSAQSLLDSVSEATIQQIEAYLGSVELPSSINKSELLQLSIELIEQAQSSLASGGVAGLNSDAQSAFAQWAAALPSSLGEMNGVRYSATSAHLKLVGLYCQVLAVEVAIAVLTGNALAAAVGGYILWHDCG